MKQLITLILLVSLAIAANGQRMERRGYDFVVPDDGDFRAAIAAANGRDDMDRRFRIFIRQGEYVIPASTTSMVMGMDSVEYPDPRTDLTASNVSIVGEGMDITSIRNTCPQNTVPGQWGPACPIEGLRNAYTLRNAGVGNYFQDFKLVNGMSDGTGRGEALEESGNRTVCKGMGLWGYQDTYCSNRDGGQYYFEGGVIRGRTDYICGKGDIVFNGVEFRHCEKGGYIAVPSRPARYGYVMLDCTITGEHDGIDGTYTLGRPWGDGTPVALWIRTRCLITPKAIGWGEMSRRWPRRMAEYASVDANGQEIDLSQRKREWKDKDGAPCENSPVLAKEEAEAITVESVLGDWQPYRDTKDAPTPTNVRLSRKGVLTWDDNADVLCWAVCKDGKVWAFTTKPKMRVPRDGSTYGVRAANQMGGLGVLTVD